jgi:hypothetical protein
MAGYWNPAANPERGPTSEQLRSNTEINKPRRGRAGCPAAVHQAGCSGQSYRLPGWLILIPLPGSPAGGRDR